MTAPTSPRARYVGRGRVTPAGPPEPIDARTTAQAVAALTLVAALAGALTAEAARVTAVAAAVTLLAPPLTGGTWAPGWWQSVGWAAGAWFVLTVLSASSHRRAAR